jgi:hypothetical protein
MLPLAVATVHSCLGARFIIASAYSAATSRSSGWRGWTPAIASA